MSIHDHTAADNCSECPMTDCGAKSATPVDAQLRGWAFAWSSVGVFVVPLIFAIAGASIAGVSETQRFFLGTGGLLLGMVLSTATYKIFSQSSRKKDIQSK